MGAPYVFRQFILNIIRNWRHCWRHRRLITIHCRLEFHFDSTYFSMIPRKKKLNLAPQKWLNFISQNNYNYIKNKFVLKKEYSKTVYPHDKIQKNWIYFSGNNYCKYIIYMLYFSKSSKLFTLINFEWVKFQYLLIKNIQKKYWWTYLCMYIPLCTRIFEFEWTHTTSTVTLSLLIFFYCYFILSISFSMPECFINEGQDEK